MKITEKQMVCKEDNWTKPQQRVSLLIVFVSLSEGSSSASEGQSFSQRHVCFIISSLRNQRLVPPWGHSVLQQSALLSGLQHLADWTSDLCTSTSSSCFTPAVCSSQLLVSSVRNTETCLFRVSERITTGFTILFNHQQKNESHHWLYDVKTKSVFKIWPYFLWNITLTLTGLFQP